MQELIQRVKSVIEKPRERIHELNKLHKQLIGNAINLNCPDCVRDAVLLLNNWVKKNDPNYLNEVNYLNKNYDVSGINLFVQVYKATTQERQRELDACLKINKSLGYFDNVIEVKERLTFRQMFDLTKEYPKHINVIANSDIYFDETILWAKFMLKNHCFALSRWDYLGDKTCVLLNRKDSQDAWIFNGEVNQMVRGEFNLGIPGCDNRIAWEIKQAGYYIKNPSKTIHAIHLHQSNVRTYDAKTVGIPEPFYFAEPIHL